jgi:hypothetical protein
LLDVSCKDVQVDEDSLLGLAEDDAEDRQLATSRLMRVLVKWLPST